MGKFDATADFENTMGEVQVLIDYAKKNTKTYSDIVHSTNLPLYCFVRSLRAFLKTSLKNLLFIMQILVMEFVLILKCLNIIQI